MAEKPTELHKKDYDVMLKEHPEFKHVISKKNWEFIGHSDKGTVSFLWDLWADNIRKNINRKLWKRHGGIATDCIGLGLNKALIGVGAGQCFNKNKEVLKRLTQWDGVKSWQDRNFIIMASNHQFKPMLAMGIIPDFVVVADASDVVIDQLTKDIPDNARNVVLLAGLHCSPKVLKKWVKQGRDIRFYLTHTQGLDKVFKEETGLDPEPHILLQGGNVINTSWSMGLKYLKTSVFMAVGNDLSFPLKDTMELRRESYYADGDYSSNAPETGTGRDEARSEKMWMGFNLEKKLIYTNDLHSTYNVTVEPVGTTQTLWVYKTWLEANVIGMATKSKVSYHYYNCTEGGIAGVMCKDDSNEGLGNEENWFLMDEVCKRWKTRTLEDAVSEFLKAKDGMTWGVEAMQSGVPPVTNSVLSL